jgi:Zn-dependent protease with chaperone function
MDMGHGLVVLGALVTALYVVVPRTLPRVAWFDRAPRWGIACWLAAALAATATIVALPILLALHLPGVGHDVADLVAACRHLLTTSRTPAGRLATLLAMVAATTPPVWIATRVAATQIAAARRRRAHCRDARVVAVGMDGATLTLDHPVPAVYCVPGAHPAIVVTTAARQRLTVEQLAAIYAHERAHLAGRHHLACGLVNGLVRALPGVAVIGAARAQVRRLTELAADDVAARHHRRGAIADAIAAVRCGHDGLDTHRERRLRRSALVPVTARHHAAALIAIALTALSLGAMVATVTSHGAGCSSHSADATPGSPPTEQTTWDS